MRFRAGAITSPIEVERNRIANGGWEWFLLVGGERVQMNDSGVGIFTGPETKPEEILPVLFAALPGAKR